MGLLVAGCYNLEPAPGPTPKAGTNVALDITDAGRVALGGSMGPEISQVNGLLLSVDTTEYVVSVKEVKLLRGGTQVWQGEPVHIRTSSVSRVYLRTFSRTRTIALVSIVAIAGAALAGKALGTSFNPTNDSTSGPPAESSKGRRRPGAVVPPILRRISPPRSF